MMYGLASLLCLNGWCTRAPRYGARHTTAGNLRQRMGSEDARGNRPRMCAQVICDRWTRRSEASDVDRTFLVRTMQEIGQAEHPSSGVPAHRCSSPYPSILDSSSSRPPTFDAWWRAQRFSPGSMRSMECAVYNECGDIKQGVISHASVPTTTYVQRGRNVQDGWMGPAASVDLQELDLELQRRIRRDHGWEAACAIRLHCDQHARGLSRQRSTHIVWCCGQDSLLAQR